MDKIKSLKEVIQTIDNNQTIALGGNVLHRAPMSMVREIVRQKRKNLKIVKTAGAHDVDTLARGKCVQSVDAGFVSYETEYGLATYYRKAVENGEVKANEHACYTVMSALNAAKTNAPFMPVYGLQISDLIDANDYFARIRDPFSGEEITVVKAIVPDVALIHVHACDEQGNAIIEGPLFDDVLLSRAAKRVIITTEKIISTAQVKIKNNQVAIPGFLVESVTVIPKGAAPCSCPNVYDVDHKVLKDFLNNEETSYLEQYLKTYETIDYMSERRTMRW